MKKASLKFLLILFFVAFSKVAFSQAMCPIEILKVNKVKGKIINKDYKLEPISDIKLELRKTNDEETLVSKTITSEDGSFEFNGIKKGEYILNIIFDFKGFYLKYRAVTKVRKTNSSKTKPSILIRFGIDCFETEAVTLK